MSKLSETLKNILSEGITNPEMDEAKMAVNPAVKNPVENPYLKEDGPMDPSGISNFENHIKSNPEASARIAPFIDYVKKKVGDGSYDHKKAPSLWQHFVDRESQHITKADASNMINKATRSAIANHLADYHHTNITSKLNEDNTMPTPAPEDDSTQMNTPPQDNDTQNAGMAGATVAQAATGTDPKDPNQPVQFDPDIEDTKDQPMADFNMNDFDGSQQAGKMMESYMTDQFSKLFEGDALNVSVDGAAFNKLFEGQGEFTSEFLTEAKNLFEAACTEKVKKTAKAITEKVSGACSKLYEAKVAEEVSIMEQFIQTTASEWLAENQVAIDSAIRAELTEGFIQGMKNLFESHYVEIPAQKVNLLEGMQNRIENLEKRLVESQNAVKDTRKELMESEKTIIFLEESRGLTEMQMSKLKTLVESATFTNAADFKATVAVLKEGVTKLGVPPTSTVLMEDNGKALSTEPVILKEDDELANVDPIVAAAVRYAKANRVN